MKAAPELFGEHVAIPSAWSISAPQDATDYSVSARDFAVEVKISYRLNAIVRDTATGRELITGWNKAAAKKIAVFVRTPTNAEAALRAVRDMVRELNSATMRAFMASAEDLRAFATGIPCGFQIVGTPRIIQRKRPRSCGYIADVIDATRDAWRRTEEAFAALPAPEQPAQ